MIDNVAAVAGNNYIHFHIVSLTVNTIVYKLEPISDSDLGSLAIGKESVIESLPSTKSISHTVERDTWHHNHINLRYIDRVITLRFFYLKRAMLEAALVIRQNIKIHAIDPRQKKLFFLTPFLEESMSRKLVRQRMIHQYMLGKHKGCGTFKPFKHRFCR
ncbi:unknown [Prevotella sp. CAG:1031]|nr:unknown [Prevotella sp. CAG:1031]